LFYRAITRVYDSIMFDGSLTPDLDANERRARLRLARSPRIGPVTFQEALQHFGSARAACARLATVAEAEVTREEQALAAAGGRFVVLGDRDYPAALAALADAPPVLSAICWPDRRCRSSAPAKPQPSAAAWPASWPATSARQALPLPRAWPAASMRPPTRPPWAAAPSPCWRAASTRSTRRRTPPFTRR
jgi:hypothetical protein